MTRDIKSLDLICSNFKQADGDGRNKKRKSLRVFCNMLYITLSSAFIRQKLHIG